MKHAIDPEADKKWKQSVKDYEKGTGRKVGWAKVLMKRK